MDLQTLAKLFRYDTELGDIVWAEREPETMKGLPVFMRSAAQVETNGGRTIEQSCKMAADRFNASGLPGKRPNWRQNAKGTYFYCQADSGFVRLRRIADALGLPYTVAQQAVMSGNIRKSKTKHGLNPVKRREEREKKRIANKERYAQATEGAKALAVNTYHAFHPLIEKCLSGKQRLVLRMDLYNLAKTDLFKGIPREEVEGNLKDIIRQACAGATTAGEIADLAVIERASPFGTVELGGTNGEQET